MHWLKINIIKWKSIPNTTDSIAEIIVSSSGFAIRHIQFIAISPSWMIDSNCEKLIPVDIHKVKYDLIGKQWAFSRNRHSPFGLKPRHVEKFRECRLTDVGESELTDKKRNMRKTRSRSPNGRSNKVVTFRVEECCSGCGGCWQRSERSQPAGWRYIRRWLLVLLDMQLRRRWPDRCCPSSRN